MQEIFFVKIPPVFLCRIHDKRQQYRVRKLRWLHARRYGCEANESWSSFCIWQLSSRFIFPSPKTQIVPHLVRCEGKMIMVHFPFVVVQARKMKRLISATWRDAAAARRDTVLVLRRLSGQPLGSKLNFFYSPPSVQASISALRWLMAGRQGRWSF